jgi:hypothetical protein
MRLRHARALGGLLKSCDDLVVHERRFDVPVGRLATELDNLRAAMRWLADVIALQSESAAIDRRAARLLAITLAAHADWLWSEVDSFGEVSGSAAWRAAAWMTTCLSLSARGSVWPIRCRREHACGRPPSGRWMRLWLCRVSARSATVSACTGHCARGWYAAGCGR